MGHFLDEETNATRTVGSTRANYSESPDEIPTMSEYYRTLP